MRGALGVPGASGRRYHHAMFEPVGTLLRPVVLALATAAAWGGPEATEAVKVRLISATPYVQPGKPLVVGLHFEMQEHWHIYWTNPGDSGEPPRVRWKLPAGFQAGPLRWPVPERLGAGSVIEYGYQGSVVLPVEIRTPSANLATGGSVTLAVEVSWLACKDLCVPGKASLTLTLPVQAAPGPVGGPDELLLDAIALLPTPLPAAWRAEATSEEGFLVLTIHGPEAARASFLPLEPEQIDNAAPQASTALPGGVRLTLRKSEQSAATPARLKGVLVLGPGRAYALSAPVRVQPPP